MSKKYIAVAIGVATFLSACGQSPSSEQQIQKPSKDAAVDRPSGVVSSPDDTKTPKWLNGDNVIQTSIGKVSWKPSDDGVGNCILINGMASLGKEDISCQKAKVQIVDYGNAITIIGTSETGGASSLPYYRVVHINQTGTAVSSIEFSAPNDSFQLNWKPEDNGFVSQQFEQDGKKHFVQLLPTRVQIISQSNSKNEPAPSEMCDFMKSALTGECVEANDCNDIISSMGNAPSSWFRAAESEPRFNFQSYMAACKAACERKPIPTGNFNSQYCNTHK